MLVSMDTTYEQVLHGGFVVNRKRNTYESRQRRSHRLPDLPVPPYENRVRRALHITPNIHAQVMHGADHVVEPGEIRPPEDRKDDSAEESADETFDGLLRR